MGGHGDGKGSWRSCQKRQNVCCSKLNRIIIFLHYSFFVHRPADHTPSPHHRPPKLTMLPPATRDTNPIQPSYPCRLSSHILQMPRYLSIPRSPFGLAASSLTKPSQPTKAPPEHAKLARNASVSTLGASGGSRRVSDWADGLGGRGWLAGWRERGDVWVRGLGVRWVMRSALWV